MEILHSNQENSQLVYQCQLSHKAKMMNKPLVGFNLLILCHNVNGHRLTRKADILLVKNNFK